LRREATALAILQAEKFADIIIPAIEDLQRKIRETKKADGTPTHFILRPIALNIFCSEEMKDQNYKIQEYYDEAIIFLEEQTEIRKDFTRILNRLEAFAMHFSHGSADEETVFSALSAVYCDFIEKAAVHLCSARDGNNTYVYGNTVNLYRSWRSRMEKLCQPRHREMIEKLRMSGKWSEPGSTDRLIESCKD
jgi:hypothetical protein